MEELIDVFLDELIDKKEISQNERTDMKLTLLEAMPNGLNDETKTRVMSTLKSKMETPSANIFTDKGVNIEAVRTIATETVKNVVETVEKETSAREEAEAKRAAKVDDALSQTIAEADEKEELAQAEKENKINENDENNYGMYFKNISYQEIDNAKEEVEKTYGESLDVGTKEYVSEMVAATRKFMDIYSESRKEGLSDKESRKKAKEIVFGGKNITLPELHKMRQLSDDEFTNAVMEKIKNARMPLENAINAVLIESNERYEALSNVTTLRIKIIEQCKAKGIKINYDRINGEDDFKVDEAEAGEIEASEVDRILEALTEFRQKERSIADSKFLRDAHTLKAEAENKLKDMSYSTNVNDLYEALLKNQDAKSKVFHAQSLEDATDRKDGVLTVKRKQVQELKESYINKAVDLYLKGDKGITEIIESFGEMADKIEISIDDVVFAAKVKVEKINPNLSKKMFKNESTINKYLIRYKACQIALENARNLGEPTESIEAEMKSVLENLNVAKSTSILFKKEFGLYKGDIQNEFEEVNQDLKYQTTEFDMVHGLNELISIREKIRNEKSDKQNMSEAINKYLGEHRITLEKFGPEMVAAFDKVSRNEDVNLEDVMNQIIIDKNSEYISLLHNRYVDLKDREQQYGIVEFNEEKFTESLLEQGRIQKELSKANEIAEILDPETDKSQLLRNRSTKRAMLNRALTEYFNTDKNVIEIWEAMANQGVSFISPYDIILELKRVSKKFGIDERSAYDMIENETDVIKEYNKINSWKILLDSGIKIDEAQEDYIKECIEMANEENRTRKEISQEIKSDILTRAAKDGKKVSFLDTYYINRDAQDMSFSGKKQNREARTKSIKETLNQETNNDIEVDTKTGVGIMNVTKVLASNNTTSQEIVGVTTELGRVVRAQDDRVVDSSEQRDS